MGEKQVEIMVHQGNSLIRFEHFCRAQTVQINGNEAFVSIPQETLGQATHALLVLDEESAELSLLPSMAVTINGAAFEGEHLALSMGDVVDIRIGAFRFNVRLVEVQRPFATPGSKEGDWRFGQILGGVAIVQLMAFLLCAPLQANPLHPWAFGIEAGPSMLLSSQSKTEPFIGFQGRYLLLPWLSLTGQVTQAFAGKTPGDYYALLGLFGAEARYAMLDWLAVSAALSFGAGGMGPSDGYDQAHEFGLAGRSAIGVHYQTFYEGLTLALRMSVMGLYGAHSERFDTVFALTPQLEYVF